MIRLFVPQLGLYVRYRYANRLAQVNRNDSYVLRRSVRAYSKAPSESSSGGGVGVVKLTLGLLTAAGLGTLGYAKFDKDFRRLLTEKVPYTDDAIKTIFLEDKTYWNRLYNFVTGKVETTVSTVKDYAKKSEATKIDLDKPSMKIITDEPKKFKTTESTTQNVDSSKNVTMPSPPIEEPISVAQEKPKHEVKRSPKVIGGTAQTTDAAKGSTSDKTQTRTKIDATKQNIKTHEKKEEDGLFLVAELPSKSWETEIKKKISKNYRMKELQEPLVRPREYHGPRILPAEVKDKSYEPLSNVQLIENQAEVTNDLGVDKNKRINLANLEEAVQKQVAETINTYNRGMVGLREYSLAMEEIVCNNGEAIDTRVYEIIKKKEDKEHLLETADSKAKKALNGIQFLQAYVNEPSFKENAPEGVVDVANKRLERIAADLMEAQQTLENERKLAFVATNYWGRFEEAKEYFSKEMEAIAPRLKTDGWLDGRKLNFNSQEDVDWFLVHFASRYRYLQSELCRLETFEKNRLQAIVDGAKATGDYSLLNNEKNKLGLGDDRRQLEEDFMKKAKELKRELENTVVEQLKLQEMIHADFLKEAVKEKEDELERLHKRTLNEKMTEERSKYKQQLACLVGRLKGIESALKAHEEIEKPVRQAQVLWTSCQSLHRAVRSVFPGVPWKEQLRPLEAEIGAIKKATAESDEFVATVLGGIPAEATARGIYPEDALRERFLKVEKVARNLALIPADGASLGLYFLSFVQSMLLVKAASPIPQAELDDEQIDFGQLDTYDILQRARYWMDRGDIGQTLRYMNLLNGASRCIARDWMKEARITLETQQAANVLMAHAAAYGLKFL